MAGAFFMVEALSLHGMSGLGFRMRRFDSQTGRSYIKFMRKAMTETMKEAKKEIKKTISGRGTLVPVTLKGIAPMTVKMRRAVGYRGKKPLRASGQMSNAVVAKKTGPNDWFVGVSKKTHVTVKPMGHTRRIGKYVPLTFYNCANIAQLNENGFTIQVTDAMRGYLHAVGHHLSPGTKKLSVPKRAFIGPAFARVMAIKAPIIFRKWANVWVMTGHRLQL